MEYKSTTTRFSLKKELSQNKAEDLENRMGVFLMNYCTRTTSGFYPFIKPPEVRVGNYGGHVKIESSEFLTRDNYVGKIIIPEFEKKFRKYIKKVNPLEIIFTEREYVVGRQ